MLSTISVKGWVLAAGIGLPVFCLFLTAMFYLFRRKSSPPPHYQIQQQHGRWQELSFGKEIDRQLLVQEVDRHLVEICRFIQEERARLLALVAAWRPPAGSFDREQLQTHGRQNFSVKKQEVEQEPKLQDQDIHGLVNELASQGLPVEQIARSLNLTVTEVELMIKVEGRHRRPGADSRSISAVA